MADAGETSSDNDSADSSAPGGASDDGSDYGGDQGSGDDNAQSNEDNDPQGTNPNDDNAQSNEDNDPQGTNPNDAAVDAAGGYDAWEQDNQDDFTESLLFLNPETPEQLNARRGVSIAYAAPETASEKFESFIEDNPRVVKGVLSGNPVTAFLGAVFDGIFAPPVRGEPKGEGLFSDARKAVQEFDEAVDRTVGPEISKGVDLASWGITGFLTAGPIGALAGFGLGMLAQPDNSVSKFSVSAPDKDKTELQAYINEQEIVTENKQDTGTETGNGIWPPTGIG